MNQGCNFVICLKKEKIRFLWALIVITCLGLKMKFIYVVFGWWQFFLMTYVCLEFKWQYLFVKYKIEIKIYESFLDF